MGTSAATEPTIQAPQRSNHYRATGIVRGYFAPADKERRKGTLVTPDAEFPATVKGPWKAPKDAQERLWNVWVKTSNDKTGLKFQLKGPYRDREGNLVLPSALPGDRFSIRGRLQWWNAQEGTFGIYVRPNRDPVRQFKPFFIVVRGHLPHPRAGAFWEVEAGREGRQLVLLDGREVHPPAQGGKKGKPAKRQSRQ